MPSNFDRLFLPPKQSYFLFGARGTGKSTWVKQHLLKALQIDLRDERTYERLVLNPGAFSEEIGSVPKDRWIVVDEIQKLPKLLDEVHRAIERRGQKFVLLGSSARKLKRTGVNLLAGRALVRHMHPLTPTEMGDAYKVERALALGTLPIVVSSEEPAETLFAYAATYLREEIQAEALVRRLPQFIRFLPVASLFHGQTMNTSSLARDAGVARMTVEGFLSVLEDTLVASRLEGYEAKLRVRERKHPKFYFFDAGLVRALRKRRGPVGAEERGPLLEGAVHGLLQAHNDYQRQQLFDQLWYWAPTEGGQTEVDFLLERQGEFVAVEVKSASTFRSQAARGLVAISELKGIRRRIAVYLGRERFKHEGIEVMPFLEFEAALASGKIW